MWAVMAATEYITLSHSMRYLIGIREIFHEIYDNVTNEKETTPTYSTIHKYGSLPQSILFEDNKACLKFASLPKKSQEQNTQLFHITSLGLQGKEFGYKGGSWALKNN